MLPTRTLWKSETPLRCCKDLHVRFAWPWALRNLYRSTSSQLKNQVALWLPATSIINCTFPRHMPRWHGMSSTVSIQKWSCACGCRLSWSCLSHCCITLTPSHAALGYDLDWPCKMNVVTCYDMWCPRVSFKSQHLSMRHQSTLRNSTRFSFIYQLPILQLPFLREGDSTAAMERPIDLLCEEERLRRLSERMSLDKGTTLGGSFVRDYEG